MSLFNQGEKAYLLLADGTILEGIHFGVKGTAIGEVVFTTGMTAYQETMTDPSYYGQLVIQTFPLIGNYGVNEADSESDRSYIRGYIVREWCNTPSNFRMEGDVNSFLEEQNIIGIHSIDTRSLTRKIREYGVMNGAITTEDVYAQKDALLEQIRAYTVKNAICSVTGDKKRVYSNPNPKYRVALFDFGYKRNIRNELVARGCEVTVLPALTSAEEVKAMAPDGIMLSNGLATRPKSGSHRQCACSCRTGHSDFRHLPRTSAAGSLAGCSHRKAEVWSPWCKPAGYRLAERPYLCYQPEPRLCRCWR